MKVADFFCGAGGFSEGFRQMGFDVVFALDLWGPAIETHELNHPKCKHSQMNILELDTPEKIDEIIPDTEVLIGSPPCVAFSGSNKAGKADKTLGLQLIEAYLRIVAYKMNKKGSILKYWVLENVPLSEPHIKEKYTFEELGLPGGKRTALKMSTRAVMNAAYYGAPQTRTRFFGGNYPLPEKVHEKDEWVTISKVLKCLKDPLNGSDVARIKDPCYGFTVKREALTDHFYDTTIEEFEWKNALRLKRDQGFMGKMSFPENMERPSRTIMATRSASTREAMIFGGRKDGDEYISYRMPTIREVSSLMSFPITYQFQGNSESSKYKLVGNAVCPMMSRAIAQSILKKEGLEIPEKFIDLPRTIPNIDLTGRSYVKRDPKPRRQNAKFSMHIPYLKVNGFRVDLSNRESDFENEKVIWTCILHTSTGKAAKWCTIDQEHLRGMFMSRFINGFEQFEDDVIKSFKGKLPGAGMFQKIYCRRSKSNKLGPEEALELMKQLVDKHYPSEKFDGKTLGSSGPALGIMNKDDIPIRILAGVYACNYVAEQVNKNK